MAIVASACIILFLALIAYYFLTRRKYPKPLPPGPSGMELVRACISAIDGTLPVRSVDWAKKYGEVVMCSMPQGNMVFLNSPSATKELLAGNHSDVVNNRMWSYVADKLCFRKCVSFSSPSDGKWPKMRKLLHSNLKFYGEGVAAFEIMVGSALKKMITKLLDKQEDDVLVPDVINDTITGIFVIMLTGRMDDKVSDAAKAFTKALFPVLDFSFSLALGICPFLDYIPGTYYWRTRVNVQDAKRNLMELLVDDMKRTRVPGTQRGVVDNLLEYQSTTGADWMTDDHLKGIIMDNLGAGINTSALTMTFMMYTLLHKHDVLRKIQDEVDTVIGQDRTPSLSDRRECHYTEAFILEILRVSCLLPLGTDHLLSEDVELKGYCIPKGSVAFNAIFAYHNSEKLWTEPDEIRPERFLDEEGKLHPITHPSRQNMLPFGAGRRSCPGETFAKARLFLFVTTIFQQLDILPPKTHDLLPFSHESWKIGFLNALKPVYCRFRPRQKSV